MTNSQISLVIEEKVAFVTIERDHRRNSLDNVAIEQFLGILSEVERSDVVAMVLTGQGSRAFCAGSDIKALASYSPEEAELHTRLFQTLAESIDELPCATIAAIDGACLGGGLELALCCDLRLATEESIFGFPEITVGALPTGGGTVRAPRAIGLSRTRELMLFGTKLAASTAREYGLISEVIASGDVRATARERAVTLAASSNRMSVQLLKAILVSGAGASTRVGHTLAYLADVSLVRSSNFKDGVSGWSSKS
jgi:enoyl-CoA hydratase/carnithine racemase